jgi:hypothetical protein
MDSSDIVTGVAAYSGIKELAPRLLGPTCDYFGEGLRNLSTKGVSNVQRVFDSAARMLGPKLNTPGQVSPRVVKSIINEAYFCDSEVAAEYFGGILASSRTNNNRYDRGAYFAGIVSRLSTYQIRSHNVIYHCFKHIFDGRRLPFNHMELHEKASIFIPTGNYVDAMDCKRYEGMGPYLDHAVVGLLKESLISDYFAHGSSKFYMLEPVTGLETRKHIGLICAPSRLGLELFLWSHGEGWQPVHQFFFSDTKFEILPEINLSFEGVMKTPVARYWGPESEAAPI